MDHVITKQINGNQTLAWMTQGLLLLSLLISSLCSSHAAAANLPINNNVDLQISGKIAKAPTLVSVTAVLKSTATNLRATEYQWTLQNTTSGQQTILPDTKDRVVLKFPDPGTYQLTVVATLSNQTTATGTRTIVVSGPATPFTLTITPKTPRYLRPPATLLFVVDHSYRKLSQDRINNKSWDIRIINNATGQVIAQGKSPNVRYTFMEPGDYQVIARASTELFKLEDEASLNVQIPPNLPPVIDDIKLGWIQTTSGQAQYEVKVFSHDDDGSVKTGTVKINDQVYTKSRLRLALEKTGTATISATAVDDSGASTTLVKEFSLDEAQTQPLQQLPGGPPIFGLTGDPNGVKVWIPSPSEGMSYDVESADGPILTNTQIVSQVTGPLVLPIGNQDYRKTVRIRLVNNQGAGPWSDPVLATVLDAPAFQVVSAPYGAVVSWPALPPMLHVQIRSQIKGAGGLGSQDFQAPPGATHYTITGLDGDTPQEFFLWVTDGTKRSLPAGPIEATPTVGLPGVPTIIQITEDVPNQKIFVQVPNAPKGTTYTVQYDDGVGLGPTPATAGGLETSPLVLPITAGQNYKTFQVQLVNKLGEGPWTDPVTVPVLAVPPAPTVSTLSEQALQVTWDPLPEGMSSIVRFWPSTGTSADALQITGGQQGPLTIPGLQPNREYRVIMAVVSGNNQTGWSPQATGHTLLGPGPSGLSFTAQDSAVTVQWNEEPGISRYELRYQAGTTLDATANSTIVANTSAVLTGMPNDQPYVIAVRGLSGTQTTTWTSPLVIQAQAAAPAHVTLQAGDRALKATWDSVGPDATYELALQSGPTLNLDTAQRLGAASNQLVIPNLVNGGQYTLAVRSLHHGGVSPWSTPATLVIGLDAPKAVTATVDSHLVTLAWSSVPGAVGYDIAYQAGVNFDGTTAVIRSLDVPVSTAQLTGLTNEQVYALAVRSRMVGTVSPWSMVVLATPSIAIPTGVQVTAGTGEITVQWPLVANVDSYDVGYMPVGNTDLTQVGILHTLQAPITITGLTNGQPYLVMVRAQIGGETSVWSEGITGTPQLTVPTQLTLVPGDASAAATWAPTSDSTSYEIGITIGPLWTDPPTTLIEAATPAAQIGSLTNGTSYLVAVRAKQGSLTSGWSSPLSVTPKLAPPTKVTGSAGESTITLFWEPNPSATGYEIQYMSVPEGTSQLLQVPEGTTAQALLNNLALTSTYNVQIRSTVGGDNSDWSVPLAVTTIITRPSVSIAPAIAGLLVTISPVPTAASYEVGIMTGSVFDPAAATLQAIPGGTTSTLQNLTPAQLYVVAARAVFPDGSRGPWSGARTGLPARPVPDLPANVNVVGGAEQIQVTWDANPLATTYEVLYQAGTAIVDGQGIRETTSLSFIALSGLTNNQPYAIMVRAVNESGASAWSSALVISTINTAAVMTVTPGFNQLQLTWSPIAGADAYDIALTQGTQFNPATSTLVTVVGPSYTWQNLNGNQVYTVAVRSYHNNRTDPWGPSTTATTVVLPFPTVSSAIPGPSSLLVAWNAIDQVPQYEIGYVAGATFNGSSATTVVSATPATQLTGLTDGQAYAVAVRSVVGPLKSDWSPATVLVPFSPPADLTGTPADTQVTVTWKNAPGATGYVLSYSQGTTYSSVGATTLLIPNVTTTSRVITGLTNGTAYTFQIQSYQGSPGSLGSNWSPPVTATPFMTVTELAPPENHQLTPAWNTIAALPSYPLFSSPDSIDDALDTTAMTLSGGTTIFPGIRQNESPEGIG